ncbi:MAG: ribonuclease H-like domain-containing protein [Candidatus Odinarchaeia archaeon]
MKLYYFDLETYSKGDKPDPYVDEVITVQYQRLNEAGFPVGSLHIVKSWEVGERKVVETCKNLIKRWEFVPVGVNLAFDFLVLRNKFRQYRYYDAPGARFKWLVKELPHIDLKHVLVLCNNCSFSKYTQILGKNGENAKIKTYYENKEYREIEKYIMKEARETILFFQNALRVLSKIHRY